MDLDLTQRVSPSVHPKAELALAALQMRLRGARCTKEGRKEGPKEDLAAAAFIFELIFLLRPSLSYALRSQRISQRERRAHLAHSLLGLPRANERERRRRRHRGIWLARTPSPTDYVAAVPRVHEEGLQPQPSGKAPFTLCAMLISVFAQSMCNIN